MLCVAEFISEDLGLVFFIVEQRHARQQRTCHGSQTRWKDLSLFPPSTRHAVQSCCRTLWILTVLTLSHRLQDTDVSGISESQWILSIYAVRVRTVTTYSEHIFNTLTFPHRTVSSSARHWHVRMHTQAHAPACARAVINTPSHYLMKAWEMVCRGEKGASPSSVATLVIWSILCNYRDLCCSTFQGEVVSQPPVEIWSVFN